MRRRSTEGFLIRSLTCVCILATLTACTTSKEKLLPHGETTMLDIWNQGTGGTPASSTSRQLLDARAVLRRPPGEREDPPSAAPDTSYTRSAANEVHRQFARLPNPDLVMYVFPHLAGTDPVPVPGYTTLFPFYQHVQYALPGERTENY